MPEDQPDPRRPAPLEITIRLDPSAAKAAAYAVGAHARSAGTAVSGWFARHARGLSVSAAIIFAAIVACIIGGAPHALAVVVAGALVYGAMHLKSRYSPLIRD